MAQTKPKAGQFYGVSGNGTDGQFLKSNGNGTMSWDSPATNPTLTSIDYPGAATAANTAGGETILINGTNFLSGVTCTIDGTSVSTTLNSATQISITSPAKAAGQYTVVLTNTNGGTVTVTNFIQYSGVPVWTTSSGSLGNITSGNAVSFQVIATEGSDTIEYAVTTGSLPSGLSLNTNTGAITGTAPSVLAATTTTFSITATDDENQTSSARSFSITVNPILPSSNFNTILYTGTGSSSSTSFTGVGFNPDMVWVKNRTSSGENHGLGDTVRGNGYLLYPNLTNTENTGTSYITPGTDGFAINTGNNNILNHNYVAWCWKAGGSAVSNTDGNITSNVSVNTDAGFSIVSWQGAGTGGNYIGHGLGVKPQLIIIKNRDNARNWRTYVSALGATKFINLDTTEAAATYGSFGDTEPTTDVFYTSTVSAADRATNYAGEDYIAYCFADVAGYQKIGTYTGTGAAGNMVETGFEPAFLLIKQTNTSGSNWNIIDNKRDTENPREAVLWADTADTESTASQSGAYDVNFLSNGFSLENTYQPFNASGGTYIYLAIAADPDVTTPTQANSFDAITYAGTSSGQSISTNFKPDLVWIKRRESENHRLFDSIRGSTKLIYSNATNAEVTDANSLTSFDSNGFSLGTSSGENVSGGTFVAWCWKAGDHDRKLPTINTTGSINSLVSANQNAGFSIVKWTGNGTNGATIGHGLSSAPEIIITKGLSNATSWIFGIGGISGLGVNDYMTLNTNSAKSSLSNFYQAYSANTFQVGVSSANEMNKNSSNGYISYCWHSVTGYSKIGTYNGTGGANTINTGFAPQFLLIKRTDSSGSWRLYDRARDTGSLPQRIDYNLNADSSGAEYNASSEAYGYSNFTSTGFNFVSGQSNADINASGGTYIYLAIA